MNKVGSVVSPGSRLAIRIRIALVVLLALAVASPLQAQAPLFLVNSETAVGKVTFTFPQGSSLDIGQLKDHIHMRGPGFGSRLRGVFNFLPFVPNPRLQSFQPPELLRDRTRLERFYRDAGFPRAQVEYEVTLDTLQNRVNLSFIVQEGVPVTLGSLHITGAQGSSIQDLLPPGLRPAWTRFLNGIRRNLGARVSESLLIRLQDQVHSWFRDRGYPFPEVNARPEGDEGEIDVVLVVDPGSRKQVGEVTIQGNSELSSSALRREIPLQPGDWFSEARLSEGERELLGLDMIRFADIQAGQEPRSDSLQPVLVRVEEGLPHLITTQVGYTTQSGISGDASWGHRNFLGDARVLEISTTARTGLWGPESWSARRYGASVLLRQPYFFHRRIEGSIRPFLEYRNDPRDRSLESGGEASVLFQRGPRRNVSLRYALTYRRILEARAGGPIGNEENLADLLAGLDTLNLDRRTSSLSLTTRWGRAGGPREPWEWDVMGSVEVAGPPGWSTVEYGKVVVEGSVGRPLRSWMRMALRVGAGRTAPFGASVPAPDGSDRLEVYLKLRDATLTAGGSQDVRGWGQELLGPKIPNMRVSSSSPDSLLAGRYIPLGGLARWTASIQMEFPFPILGWPHGIHLFMDGGRIWTPDGRFLPTDEGLVPGQLGGKARFGAGLGASFSTPVGPFQVDVGYKLNPSPLDTRSPGAVARALAAGTSVEDVPEEAIRRWHLHFSIGRIR